MKGVDKFEAKERDAGLASVLDYIKGASEYGSLYDDLGDLQASELKASLEKQISTATPAQRAKLNFDLALLRSLQYAVASSRHCLVLGVVNGVRELYEGSRLTGPYSDP